MVEVNEDRVASRRKCQPRKLLRKLSKVGDLDPCQVIKAVVGRVKANAVRDAADLSGYGADIGTEALPLCGDIFYGFGAIMAA